jgi:transposase
MYPMDMRELKALEIAARSKITFDGKAWIVPSQSGKGTYRVTVEAPVSCPCEDFATTGQPCKHVLAARLVCERDHGGKHPEIVVDAVPKRKTYRQNWTAYNLAQCSEKDRFQELLFELCQGVEEPPRSKKAGKRISLADRVFACAFKVFSTFSGRRFMSDLNDAFDRGFIRSVVNPMTVMDFTKEEAMTPVLYQLIERSAWPLRAIESTFAPDSSGFSTSRFVRWFDEKYGTERSGRAWVKAHVMTGTKTNVITTAIVDGPTAGDSPMFRSLVEQTLANGFKIETVCADKGYLSKENLELTVKHGATPFIPFKVNSVPGDLGTLWEKLFAYFQFNRADFLARYHQRSNVESTFSMVKAKFRDSVRCKSDTSMKNEVLLKFLCHNVVVVHQAIIELGIEETFWPEKPTGERSVLPFDRRNQNGTAGISG